MPARKRAQFEPKPSVLRGDLAAPMGETTVFGHKLVLDGEHFDVACASRWTDFEYHRQKGDWDGERLDLECRAIFNEAMLRANPDWDEERFRLTLAPIVMFRVLSAFFRWRLEINLPTMAIQIQTLRGESPSYQTVAPEQRTASRKRRAS